MWRRTTESAARPGPPAAPAAPAPGRAPRVFLRAPRCEDAPAFLARVEASRSFLHPWVDAPEDAASFRFWSKRAASRRCAGFLVCLCGSGEIAGVANLNDLRRDDGRRGGGSASLGFYAFAAYTGRGYVTEGAARLLERGFEELGLARVTADVRADNRASRAALCRLGFCHQPAATQLLRVGGAWRPHQRWQLEAPPRAQASVPPPLRAGPAGAR